MGGQLSTAHVWFHVELVSVRQQVPARSGMGTCMWDQQVCKKLHKTSHELPASPPAPVVSTTFSTLRAGSRHTSPCPSADGGKDTGSHASIRLQHAAAVTPHPACLKSQKPDSRHAHQLQHATPWHVLQTTQPTPDPHL